MWEMSPGNTPKAAGGETRSQYPASGWEQLELDSSGALWRPVENRPQSYLPSAWRSWGHFPTDSCRSLVKGCSQGRGAGSWARKSPQARRHWCWQCRMHGCGTRQDRMGRAQMAAVRSSLRSSLERYWRIQFHQDNGVNPERGRGGIHKPEFPTWQVTGTPRLWREVPRGQLRSKPRAQSAHIELHQKVPEKTFVKVKVTEYQIYLNIFQGDFNNQEKVGLTLVTHAWDREAKEK